MIEDEVMKNFFECLELQYVSPKLLKCRDLELAVPGSYVPGKPVIQIAQMKSFLQVITSKQRPRKLYITGELS
jgi:FKBP12-rapamycin complex-associated protein